MNEVSQPISKEREFVLTDVEFKNLTNLVRSITGIVLGDNKKEMVYSRLARRLRKLGMDSFSQYCALLESNKSDSETGFLVNAITTNLTKFYRESHHFDFLADHMTEILNDAFRRKGDKKIRIWSAGCSSGEEPYSISSTLLNKTAGLNAWDVKILATDLDTNMLEKGRSGTYSLSALEAIPDDYRAVFNASTRKKNDKITINSNAMNLVHFKQLNLLHQWPMKKKYDVIFCRNVLIYFDAKTKESLVERYAEMLLPGGILFLGHSESLLKNCHDLDLIGRTAYRKRA